MSKPIIIIAEAGVNHNGDMKKAEQLIDVAVEAGVDYVKFQSFVAEKLVSPQAKKAEYQTNNIGNDDDFQLKMLKELELSNEDHLFLMDYCSQRDIKFFSTAFDIDGIHYLDSLDIDIYKIPSGEITNFPYLRAIAQKRKPIILSTGMATLGEIEDAIFVLMKYGAERDKLTVLHCNTEYPTPMEDVNLKAMLTIGQAFGVNIGYSDHTLGIEVPIAAVALGATVIEKHFTLDRNLKGPDHKASLEPYELKSMVTAIRNIEKAIGGSGRKEPSISESRNVAIARKSIHLNKNLSKGQVITEDDIISLRPGDGISPMEWENIIGKKLIIDKNKFDKLIFSDIV